MPLFVETKVAVSRSYLQSKAFSLAFTWFTTVKLIYD